MSITSPDDRISTYNPVVATTEFAAGFPVFDNDDIAVFHDGIERTDFAVTATYAEGIATDAKAVFAVGITGKVQVIGSRDPHRTNRFQNGAPLPTRDQNLALDTLESEMQEARRDIDRAVMVELGGTGFEIQQGTSGQIPVFDGNGNLIPGTPAGGGNMMREIYDPRSKGGDAFPYDSVTDASGAVIPPGIKRIRTQFYATANRIGGANYRRESLADLGSFPALSYFRSTDRFMPDGSTDAVNGGYWVLDEVNSTPQMLGAIGDGVANDTAALNAWADYISSGSLSAGLGETVTPPSGRYLIRDTVTFKFGTNFVGPEGSARYGFVISVDAANWSGASVAVIIQAETEAFTAAKVTGLTVDVNGVSGVEGIRFEGAYQNAAMKNIWVYDTPPNAIGLHVKPLDRVGAATVCESLLLENIYVIPAATVGTVTQPGILLDRCQETTLINVKGFDKLPGDAATPGAAGIKLLDCRGITMLGCSAAFAKYGIEIEALTRQSTGFTIVGPTYEGISDVSLYVHGTATNKVANVTQTGTRIESPQATFGVSVDYVDYMVADAAFQNVNLGANVTSVFLDGFGTVTAAAGAKFARVTFPNAVTDKYVLRATHAVVKDNTPSYQLMVDGRTGQYQWRWSATASVDNWSSFVNPAGNTLITMGETAGTGVARLGFFGVAAIQRPTVAAAATDAATTQTLANSLRTQLIALGLVQ